MEFQVRKIVYEGGSTRESDVMIEPLSDMHVGARFHDKAKFREVVDRIREDPRRYTFIMGDIFDATTPENKFFDPESCVDPELPTLEHQYNYVVNLLRPLAVKGKILGVHCGNHDERLRRRHFSDYVLRLVDELNRCVEDENERNANQDLEPIRYLRYTALTRLVFMRRQADGSLHNDGSFDFYTAHGGYSGRRPGGNLNNAEDMEANYSADVYLTGHTHQVLIHKKEKIGMDRNGNLKTNVKLFAVCGSFARPYNEGFTTYPEYKNMPASRVGTITIGIMPHEGKLHGYE